jgi:hypothetical protein
VYTGSEFIHTIKLPCLGETIRVRELPNKIYKNILKYIQTGDSNALAEYFLNVIDYVCVDDIDISTFNKADIFYILLFIRYACISSDLRLNFECEKTKKPYSMSVDIPDIISSIDNNMFPEIEKQYNLDYNITVKIGIPDNIFTSSSILDSIVLCLREVIIGDNTYDLHRYSFDERHEIVNRLPSDFLPKVIEYITAGSDAFRKVPVLENKSPHDDDMEVKLFELSLFDNSMFDFLHLIYNDTLQNHFYMSYVLVSKLHFDSHLVNDLTPVECNVYLRQYVEEVERHNDQVKQQSQSNTTSLPNTLGSPDSQVAF